MQGTILACDGCSIHDSSAAELPCDHAICIKCVDNQAFFLPKVHRLGSFVCCGCGLKYPLGQYFPKFLEKPSSPVPLLNLRNTSVGVPGIDIPYRASTESIDQFEEEMGPHFRIKTANDLTVMLSPKDIGQFLTPRHIRALIGGEGVDTAKNSMREVSEGGFSSRSNMPNSTRPHYAQIKTESSSKINQIVPCCQLNLKWHIPSFPDSIRRMFDEKPKLTRSKPKGRPNGSTLVLKYNHFLESSAVLSKTTLEKKESAKEPEKCLELLRHKEDNSRNTILGSNLEQVQDSKKSCTRDLFDSFALDNKNPQEKSVESSPEADLQQQKIIGTEIFCFPPEKQRDSKKKRQLVTGVQSTLDYLDLEAFQKIQPELEMNFFRPESDNRSFSKQVRNSNSADMKSKDIDIELLKKKIESKEAMRSHQPPIKSGYLSSLNKSKILRTSEILGMKTYHDSAKQQAGLIKSSIYSTHSDKSQLKEEVQKYQSANQDKSWFTGFYQKGKQNAVGISSKIEAKDPFSVKRETINQPLLSKTAQRDQQNLSYSSIKQRYNSTQSEFGEASPRKRLSTANIQALQRRMNSNTYEGTPRRSPYGRNQSSTIKPNLSLLMSGPSTPLKYPSKDYSSKAHSISYMIDSISSKHH